MGNFGERGFRELNRKNDKNIFKKLLYSMACRNVDGFTAYLALAALAALAGWYFIGLTIYFGGQ